MSVCPSAQNNSALDKFLIKFDIWVFFQNLVREFNSDYNLTRMTGTLHDVQLWYLTEILIFWFWGFTPCKTPEPKYQYSSHGESLKSRYWILLRMGNILIKIAVRIKTLTPYPTHCVGHSLMNISLHK
jgi:hypothetical protein